MKTFTQIMLATKLQATSLVSCMKDLNIKGSNVNGVRLWSQDEVRQIVQLANERQLQ